MSRTLRNISLLLVGLVTGLAALSQNDLFRDRALAAEPIATGSATRDGAAGMSTGAGD